MKRVRKRKIEPTYNIKIDMLDQTLKFNVDYIENGLGGFLNVSLSDCQLARFLKTWCNDEKGTYFTIEHDTWLYYCNDNYDDIDCRYVIGNILENGKWLIFGCCFY